MLGKTEEHRRTSLHETDLLQVSGDKAKRCFETISSSSNNFKSVYKELPFFLNGFYHHHVSGDFEKAEELYKEALRRAEFTLGCYNMIVSIYLS